MVTFPDWVQKVKWKILMLQCFKAYSSSEEAFMDLGLSLMSKQRYH